ncbi:hypothetical protein BH11BAC5_BH11BAC5_34700 [soil metagenome]
MNYADQEIITIVFVAAQYFSGKPITPSLAIAIKLTGDFNPPLDP